MGHHHFPQDGMNTLLKLQDKTPDSVFTRDPMAEGLTCANPRRWRRLCGTEMENLSSGWRLRSFVYELWIKAHPSMFCSSLVQLTWLPSNCLGRKRTANTDVEDWLEFSKTVILLDLGRLEVLEPGRFKDRLNQTVNIQSNYVLLECSILNWKMDTSYEERVSPGWNRILPPNVLVFVSRKCVLPWRISDPG